VTLIVAAIDNGDKSRAIPLPESVAIGDTAATLAALVHCSPCCAQLDFDRLVAIASMVIAAVV
jgi:hypothetical protein